MTRAQDQIALDSAKASRIAKEVADQTATALNIQYIQKDISEIKGSMDKLATAQDGKVEDLQRQVNSLARVAYIGMGALSVLELALKFFIR